MARTSVVNTIQRIRRQLSSGYRLETNLLNGSLTSTATTISLVNSLPTGLQPGAILYIDLEALRVTTINASAQTMTVIRGYYDSDATTHSANAEVVINPRFSPLDIYDAIYDEVASYGPQLYRVGADEFTVQENQDTLNLLPAWNDCFGIIDVRRQWDDNGGVTAWPRQQVRFQRGTQEWDGTNGTSILRFVTPVTAGTIYVQVARPFNVSGMSYIADLYTDVGLPESMLDVLGMGVKLRLAVDNEQGRTARTAQDEPRRAEETPVGANVQNFQLLNALYRNRKQEEINKLRAQWPVRYT